MSTHRDGRSLAACIALIACAALASFAIAHDDDPKAQSWEPPFVGPVWHLGDGGVADSYDASGVQLMSWFPVTTFDPANTSGNDCWGYVSPSGREYALIGLSNGTGVVEITNPAQSQIVAFLSGPQSLWRNIKVYKHYMYAVSEGGGGIQVFDLAQIDNGIVTTLPSVTTGGVTSTHTMIINTTSGYLYRMGGSTNGIRIYNLEPNPAAPAYVGSWSDKYVHDGCVFTYTTGPYAGKEIYFACGGLNSGYTNPGVSVLDITNKSSIVKLSEFTYSGAQFCHQIWPTEDKHYAYINDELDEANLGVYSLGRIFDISNLSAPVFVGTYTTGLQTVDHNEYVRGNTLFCSNYKSGLRIFDLTDPTNPVQTGWFDTYPADNSAGYAGLWCNHPFFPSGTIIGSDIQRGLFVWRLGNPSLTFSYPNGLPSNINPQGMTIQVNLNLAPGAALVPGTALMKLFDGAQETDIPLTPVSGNLYQAAVPPTTCGHQLTYMFTAGTDDGLTFNDPAPPTVYNATSTLGQLVTWSDDFEADKGWVVGAPGDAATTGIWVRVDPVGTAAQPEDDHTPTGTKCFVTGQGIPGGGVGDNDVDGGATTLTSPTFDATLLPEPYIGYWRWYSNNQGSNPNTNTMPISISNNNGASWVQLELVSENQGIWVQKKFRISDFVAPTTQMKLRVVARDLTGAVVEAGLDDVSVFGEQCPAAVPGDLNGDGIVDGADLGILLGHWGSAGPGDFDGNGIVDGADLGFMLGHWG